MAFLNKHSREIIAKVVYFGPPQSGKTTNFQMLHKIFPPTLKSAIIQTQINGQKALAFNLAAEIFDKVPGYTVKFQLCTIPGSIKDQDTLSILFRGVDAIVFVADSTHVRLFDNIQYLEDLGYILESHNRTLRQLPFIIQYNKRDIMEVLTVETLQKGLNFQGYSWIEASAINCNGVMETFERVGKLLIQIFQKRFQEQPALPPVSLQTKPIPESFPSNDPVKPHFDQRLTIDRGLVAPSGYQPTKADNPPYLAPEKQASVDQTIFNNPGKTVGDDNASQLSQPSQQPDESSEDSVMSNSEFSNLFSDMISDNDQDTPVDTKNSQQELPPANDQFAPPKSAQINQEKTGAPPERINNHQPRSPFDDFFLSPQEITDGESFLFSGKHGEKQPPDNTPSITNQNEFSDFQASLGDALTVDAGTPSHDSDDFDPNSFQFAETQSQVNSDLPASINIPQPSIDAFQSSFESVNESTSSYSIEKPKDDIGNDFSFDSESEQVSSETKTYETGRWKDVDSEIEYLQKLIDEKKRSSRGNQQGS